MLSKISERRVFKLVELIFVFFVFIILAALPFFMIHVSTPLDSQESEEKQIIEQVPTNPKGGLKQL